MPLIDPECNDRAPDASAPRRQSGRLGPLYSAGQPAASGQRRLELTVLRSAAADEVDTPALTRWQRWLRGPQRPTYLLTRFAILRLLGLVYLVAFLTVIDQGPGLLGERGLMPIGNLALSFDSPWQAFLERPSLLWFAPSNATLLACGWIGLILSMAVLLGFANGIILFALWLLHTSISNVGQLWYAFGWEYQLLETGFIAIFLVPFIDGRPFPKWAPPWPSIALFRWLIIRIMLGAGLIKLRGDPCWRELTCLSFHYETQPIPNPLSPFFHALPMFAHQAGALFNHFVELIVPLFVVGPRRFRHAAGVLLIAFQLTLILSGNLSYLNWLTIIPALACFDDSLLRRLLPTKARLRFDRYRQKARGHRGALGCAITFALIVAILSIQPIANLASKRQRMNSSFDRLHLVNTYGAFGSVGRRRYEIVFEGSYDSSPGEDDWFEIEFRCKPGDVDRRPCLISPYHRRLDWLVWFAAMGPADRSPWVYHLAYKILSGESDVVSLLAPGPIHERAPLWLRASYYAYELEPPFADRYWRRRYLRRWIRPLKLDDPDLRRTMRGYGWLP